MILVQMNPARPDYWDRKPAYKTRLLIAPGVPPHGVTQRWGYTVPAGRVAIVHTLRLRIRRQTAGAPGTNPQSWIQDVIGNLFAYVDLTSNVAQAIEDLQLSPQIALAPGDGFFCFTTDPSTGGTCDYSLFLQATEFDV